LGLTLGLLNIFPFLGPAALQILTGAIMDRSGMVNGIYPPIAFKEAFLVCLLFFVFCLVLFSIVRKQLFSKEISFKP
jgi:hypothetical protein